MPIGNTVYLFTRRQIGDDNELGRTLIRGFLNNLSKQEVLPRLLFFMNEGTYLCYTEDETLLTPLRTLAEKGVDIAICKTCLDAYNLDAAKMPVSRGDLPRVREDHDGVSGDDGDIMGVVCCEDRNRVLEWMW